MIDFVQEVATCEPAGGDDIAEAERYLIGAMLCGLPIDINPRDFASEQCRHAASAIRKAPVFEGLPDIGAVVEVMPRLEGQSTGDIANWLINCMGGASSDGQMARESRCRFAVETVHNAAGKRALSDFVDGLIERASDDSLHIGETLDYILERHAELSARQQRGGLIPLSVADIIEASPVLSDPVIDGLVRHGETVNVIADPKRGKSWLAYGMALSVAHGLPWMGYPTNQGRVLIIDNELHRSVIAHRIPRVAEAMGVSMDGVDIVSLRGRLTDLYGLRDLFQNIKDRGYSLVILDAFYRFLPEGVSENDNSQMAGLYNTLDRYAAETGAAIACIHHASKGSQSFKRTTDVGAGAGAQSRAADCHLVLREHEEDGCVVLDAAVRSFPPVEPVVLRWEFPLWHADADVDPSRLKGLDPKAEKQRDADLEAQGAVLDALDAGPLTRYAIQKTTGFGSPRVARICSQLMNAGYVDEVELPVNGRPQTHVRKTLFAR